MIEANIPSNMVFCTKIEIISPKPVDSLVWFYGISTIVGYFYVQSFLYIYIYIYIVSNICFLNTSLYITFLNESELIFFTLLNGVTDFYLIRIILFTINHLLAHSSMFSNIGIYN